MGLPDPQPGLLMGSGVSAGVTPSHLLVRIPVFLRHSLPFSQRRRKPQLRQFRVVSAKLPAELPPTSMEFNTVDRFSSNRRRQCYQPERECSLGIAFHVHLIGGRIIAAQRRVERHQVIVSGIVAVNGQLHSRFPPSLFIGTCAAILRLPPMSGFSDAALPGT